MDTMVPIRPALLRPRRISLPSRPVAAAEARRQVRAYIYAWDVPVDPPTAELLTSELVTNAIRHEAGETVMLVLTCPWGQLRIEVHDTSPSMPVPIDAPADAETGRGLMLVTSLSSEWGWYRTSAGKAVYFTLAFQADMKDDDYRTSRANPANPRPSP
jgi:anti-sigma regulatory factor (Ser/Thr protein kinase)